VCSPINGVVSYCVDSPNELADFSFTTLVVQQKLVSGGKYEYSVLLNSQIILKKINNDARVFNNVKVFTSNPFNVPAPKELKILTYEFTSTK